MKKILLTILACISVIALSFSVNIKAAPTTTSDITVSGPNDLKGCYYIDNNGTQEWTGEQCFKDERLREVVYEDLVEFYKNNKAGNDDTGLSFDITSNTSITFKNTNMRTIIAGFRGDVKAKGKGITSIKGIQFLTHAQTVDLRKNKISDLTELNVSVQNSSSYDKKYYGYGTGGTLATGGDPDDFGVARNVTWDLGGNPFKKIPHQFGGRLVIKATQTTSSNYEDAEQEKFIFKRNNMESFSGQLNIFKCQIMVTDNSGNPVDSAGNPTVDASKVAYRDTDVTTINIVKTTTGDDNPEETSDGIKVDTNKGDINSATGQRKGYTNRILYFKDLQTSRHQRIGVGIDQELHYTTADELDTGTPGSQSFKYYIDPTFYVYDVLDVSANVQDDVELSKVDEATRRPLTGAEYSLYRSETLVKSGLKTDAVGKLKVTGLGSGEYRFIETKAPIGYVLDDTPVPFTISAGIDVSGGTKTFTETQGDKKTYTAASHEVYMAGVLDNDIVLSLENPAQIPTSVDVKYSSLYDPTLQTASTTTKNYNTIALAQDAINSERKAGHIRGRVEVMATFATTQGNEIKVKHSNTKIPEPTPVPPKPTPPTPTPPSPSTGDTTTISLFIALAAISGSYIIIRSKKEKR